MVTFPPLPSGRWWISHFARAGNNPRRPSLRAAPKARHGISRKEDPVSYQTVFSSGTESMRPLRSLPPAVSAGRKFGDIGLEFLSAFFHGLHTACGIDAVDAVTAQFELHVIGARTRVADKRNLFVAGNFIDAGLEFFQREWPAIRRGISAPGAANPWRAGRQGRHSRFPCGVPTDR